MHRVKTGLLGVHIIREKRQNVNRPRCSFVVFMVRQIGYGREADGGSKNFGYGGYTL